MLAQSPKYPALYDITAGVRFRKGRAEVTDEQALKLAERRYVDGILVEGTPAKDWAKTRRRETATAAEPTAEELTEPATTDSTQTVAATPDEGRRRNTRSK